MLPVVPLFFCHSSWLCPLSFFCLYHTGKAAKMHPMERRKHRKKGLPSPVIPKKYGQQDLNLHGLPPEPKSGASANSAMPAYLFHHNLHTFCRVVYFTLVPAYKCSMLPCFISSRIFIKKEVLVLNTSVMRHRGFEPRTT